MKTPVFKSTILIHPGLNNSGPEHWQTHWEKRFNFDRVQQDNWDTPVREEWIEALDWKVNEYNHDDIIIVGHSLACCTIAWWASHYNRKIKGALLVAPSDTEAKTYPAGTTGFKPMPLQKLPFASITVTTDDDYYVTRSRATQFANAWGSELINIGHGGHINVSSGHTEWNEGLTFLSKLDNL